MCVATGKLMHDTHHEEAERLHSGAPFWLVKNGIPEEGQPLDGVVDCDVVVIGAGISGALVADALTAHGIDVVVLDRNEPGCGSTGASTALLLYDLDVELTELAQAAGIEDAVEIYRLSASAVQSLAGVALSLGGCGIAMKEGLYLASHAANADRLAQEAELRALHGLPARFIGRREVESRYGMKAHGALLSGGAAQLDPLRLTVALLQRAMRRGARVHTQTTALHAGPVSHGVEVRTTRGGRVRARRVVYAMGYELPPDIAPNVMSLHSTYVLATHRLESMPAWLERTLVWETARPYAYLRTSGDGRIIIGGEDVPYKSASIRDRLLPSRIARLERRLGHLVPGLPARTAFAWAGTFAETPDCLPYIGPHPRFPGAFVALGYGGNGLTYSMLAARLLADELQGKPHYAARLFSPARNVRRRSPTPPCGASGVARGSTPSIGAIP
jgi:glycine/D-amino acid oxidase-like deaminating enzyme